MIQSKGVDGILIAHLIDENFLQSFVGKQMESNF
jgi:hypothetical protein